MLKMSGLLKGTVIAALIAFAFGSVALTSALASGIHAKAATTSADTLSQMTDEALQSQWSREVSRLGFGDIVVSRIEKAVEREALDPDGELPMRLDALLNSAKRLFGKAQAAVASHAGFDSSGTVTDRAQAVKSIQSLEADLHGLRTKLIIRLDQLIR